MATPMYGDRLMRFLLLCCLLLVVASHVDNNSFCFSFHFSFFCINVAPTLNPLSSLLPHTTITIMCGVKCEHTHQHCWNLKPTQTIYQQHLLCTTFESSCYYIKSERLLKNKISIYIYNSSYHKSHIGVKVVDYKYSFLSTHRGTIANQPSS